MLDRSLRCLPALALAIGLAIAARAPVFAANANAYLNGVVTSAGLPVADAHVTATGDDVSIATATDSQGRFSLPALLVGTYVVEAHKGGLDGRVRVDLASAGATVTIALLPTKQLGHILVTSSAPVSGSGNDVVINSNALTRMPINNSFPEMEIQLPAAARGANGVVHMNGDHGVILYMLDGVPLPEELNRDIGGEINPNDLSFIDLVEGAYPAQYGMKFGSVFNMATRAGTGPAGSSFDVSAGSYTDAQSTVGYHAPIAGGGGYDVAFSGLDTSRGLDPPDFNSPHNDASSLNQFARLTVPRGDGDFTGLTFLHSESTFQIPDDTQFGEPAWTDDSEYQEDTFLAVQAHHNLGADATLTYGPAVKVGNIQDFGDPAGDFAYGEALNVLPAPYGNGEPSDACAEAYVNRNNPSAPPFLPTTCADSLTDSRTATDYIWQTDYTKNAGKHVVASGVLYDFAHVLKDYDITLQPDNFLAPLVTPDTPDAPTTVVDDAPNIGNTYESYLQDSWRLSRSWEADYGVRYDFYNLKSTDYDDGFGGVSPRLKLTRYIGQRASIYAYIGRFFEPPSFENVSPQAAYELNLPLQRSVAAFDLKPERDTQLEVGGHLPFGSGDLGWRVMQKNANDLIDDTQVGVTLLHQDVNYVLGRISEESINYTNPLPLGRIYLAVAHVDSVNDGCETQLLAPCFGQPTDFTPADHEQRYSVSTGWLVNDQRGGWFSTDGEYGSGLSSAVCPPTTPGYCKQTPHTTFDVEKGVAFAPHTALTFGIQNLLNDRYYVTLLNAQGTHYAPPREFTVGIRYAPPD